MSEREPTKNNLKVLAKLIADEKMGNFRSWNLSHGYYSYKNLIAAIDVMDNAPRYSYFVSYYFLEVLTFFREKSTYVTLTDKIAKALEGTKYIHQFDENEIPKIIVVKDTNREEEYNPSLKIKMRYYISKFFEQKYFDDLGFVRNWLLDYPQMIAEIEHMEKHWTSDKDKLYPRISVNRYIKMEYYSSLLYLQHLIDSTEE